MVSGVTFQDAGDRHLSIPIERGVADGLLQRPGGGASRLWSRSSSIVSRNGKTCSFDAANRVRVSGHATGGFPNSLTLYLFHYLTIGVLRMPRVARSA